MDDASGGWSTLTTWSHQPQKEDGDGGGEHDELLAWVLVIALLIAVGGMAWKLIAPLFG